jgi:L-seryl-tRNA(Ser) seleniumtransferase
VSAVLAHELLAESTDRRGRVAVRRAIQMALRELRRELGEGLDIPADLASVARRSRQLLDEEPGALQPVINATGVLLHTGLGRAPLADEAVEAVARIASGYCDLELELDEGTRGHRTTRIAALLRELTGALAATVVNNNAGATLLALRALAAGQEVIISRSQLIEIGGSFRLPEIFEVSGAILREVGTTNKTRLADYEHAIGPRTSAILRVHRSNFRIVGFTEESSLSDLVGLAHARGLWAIDDIGSGALEPGCPPGAGDEPTAKGALAAGADLVLFSGDKLLGGPQCGIMLGRREAIARIEADPLLRALRIDKMTLAALEATLRLARDPEHAVRRIPLWSMIATPLEDLTARATRLAAALSAQSGLNASVVPGESYLGGGSAPFHPIPSMVVAIRPPFSSPIESEAGLAMALRRGRPPVVARVQKGMVLLDLRTVPEREEPLLLDAIRRVCHDRGGGRQQPGAGAPVEARRAATEGPTAP